MAACEEFWPRIVAFLCNWCTYTGADLAGVSRTQYPPNIRPIRVMCSGSVDPMYILKALLDGADGVLIGGCHPGDCHYVNGNYKARRRLAVLSALLDEFGIGSERVWFRFISASEGALFARTVQDMVAHLRELGPNPARTLWLA